MNAQIKQQILKHKIVSIVRGISKDSLVPVMDALCRGGIRCVEITLNTPGALQMIQQAKEVYGSRMLVGAGTVMDKPSAVNAVSAGADFLLSPVLEPEVIEVCHSYSKAAVPGIMTPTEAYHAWKEGADIIKLFPASSLHMDYVKNLLGPMNRLDIMAVGGVSQSNLRAFLDSGVCCFGIGSELVSRKLVKEKDYESIAKKAQTFMELVH